MPKNPDRKEEPGATRVEGKNVKDSAARSKTEPKPAVERLVQSSQTIALVQQLLRESETRRGTVSDPSASLQHPTPATGITGDSQSRPSGFDNTLAVDHTLIDTRDVRASTTAIAEADAQTKEMRGTGGQTIEDNSVTPVRDAGHHAPTRPPTRVERAPSRRVLTERYQDMGQLGAGGMGEVRRVRDRLLNRVLAMKILHDGLMDNEGSVLRFVQEAQVVAQLQHPNILPVHELGVLDDGPVFFTMAEIKGHSLSDHIKWVHATVQEPSGAETPHDWNLHQLIDMVHDVCKAVSYAHTRGVVHRDLKPKNVMIGPLGEVLVVDWGLAKVLGQADATDGIVTMRSQLTAKHTMAGTITGTPAYMAPEQALGRGAEADERSDIYAVGAILYEALRGRPAYEGDDPYLVLNMVATEAPLSFATKCDGPAVINTPESDPHALSVNSAQPFAPVSCSGAPVPIVLVEVCQRAMARNPDDRYQSMSDLVEIIGTWLDGSKKRDDAMALVAEAEKSDEAIENLKTEAASLRARALELTESVSPWQSEDHKVRAWELEDRAANLSTDALIMRTEQTQLFRGALARKSDLQEAHSALAEQYRAVHRAAEAAGEVAAARRAEVILREHVRALPPNGNLHKQYVDYLDGTGSLSVDTVPRGAKLEILPFVRSNRRLVRGQARDFGVSPLEDARLEMGSFLLRARLPGYHDALCPVNIRRLEQLTGKDPSGRSVPIQLLQEGTLGPDDCYIPAGWTWLGGDDGTPNSLPLTHAWIDGFVIRRFPVTHGQYLLFLNALIAGGQTEEALLHVPREQSSSDDELGAMAYLRDADGPFRLPDDPKRTICWPEQPVTMIQWRSARAYARWYAEKTDLPWRLPMEFEWEKSARGVDARSYPWGDAFDPSWACMKDSHQAEVRMENVDTFPFDESVYGVRGTAGNTRDWCLDRFRESGPPLDRGRLLLPTPADLADTGFKSTRGGSYGNSASRARSADRDWWFPDRSYVGRGVRLAWGL